MTVAVVDYGMGNLGSVLRALEDLGTRPEIVATPERLTEAERIILPGVGNFAVAMERLNALGLVGPLRSSVEAGRPLLGICLGMQLLASRGEEGGSSPGLALVPGDIVRIDPREGERVPHIGWNEVHETGSGHALFTGIPSGTDFYFVHSFQFRPETLDDALAVTDYAGGLVSVVGRGHVTGVQFHPEKSSRAGRRMLGNWLMS